ncbi:MAG: site-2 protease family protein [Pirellulaceae bacterium]
MSHSDLSNASFHARNDLVLVSRLDASGAPSGNTVVKDPITLRYWLLNEAETAVLKWLRSPVDLPELKSRLEGRFFPKRTTLTEMQSVIGMLHRRGLLLSSAVSQPVEMERRRSEQAKRRGLQWANPLMLRIPGINPGFVTDPLTRKIGWVFCPTVMIAWCLFAFFVTVMVFNRRGELMSDLPVLDEFLSWQTLPMLMISLAIAKVVHELGHAVVCTHLGARCQEIGFALFFFSPCLYADTTDCWILPQRWKRITVALAGVGAELVLASVVALMWCLLPAGVLRQQLFYLFATCTVFSWMINLNPLLRYDGYYVLSDWVNEPNLHKKSRESLKHSLYENLLGIQTGRQPRTTIKWKLFLVGYAIASMIYRTLVIALALYFVFGMFDRQNLPGIGLGLCLLTIILMATPATKNLWKQLRRPNRSRGSRRRSSMTAVCFLVLLGFVMFIPLPHHVVVQGTIRSVDDTPIYVTSAGRIRQIHLAAGAMIQAGEPLATLTNPDLETRQMELSQRMEATTLKLKQYRRRQGTDDNSAAQIESATTQLAELQNQQTVLERELAALNLSAPMAGRIYAIEPSHHAGPQRSTDQLRLASWSGSPLEPANLNAWLDAGTAICRIGSADEKQVICQIHEEDLGTIRSDATAEILVGSPASQITIFTGKVGQIAQTPSFSKDDEVSSGGAKSGNWSSQSNVDVSTTFEVSVTLNQPWTADLDGTPATVRVRCGSQSVATRLRTVLGKHFDWKW